MAERLSCPRCGGELPTPSAPGADVVELSCRGCGERLRVRRRSPSLDAEPAPGVDSDARAIVSNGLELSARIWLLRALGLMFRVGQAGGAGVLLMLGGFVPVLGAWLRDEIEGWGDVVTTLGGVHVQPGIRAPDGDLGAAIARQDAPRLFDEIETVARRLGVRPPEQVRLTYLPCCGVTAWGRSRALFLGLPLLDVLTRAELRAVLAHELTHLARGDATVAARALRFQEVLGQVLDGPVPRSRSPLRSWARLCRHLGDRLAFPVARGQEARADRAAAEIAGGDSAASALVKVAIVQPLFREVLDHYDPSRPDLPNLYAFFRGFWSRIPEELQTAMRHKLLSARERPSGEPDGPHPPLLDRLSVVQPYAARPRLPDDADPAVRVLGDLDALETMLHNRLFGVPEVERSTFHRAGSS